MRRPPTFCFVACVLVLLAVPACAAPGPVPQRSQGPAVEDAVFPADSEALLRIAVDRALARHQVPGAIVGFWVEGKGSFLYAAGEADVATHARRQVDEHFRIGDITKTFTCTAVLVLAKQGELALDDAVGMYVPGTPNDAVTIRQLCAMQSGLPDYANVPGLLEQEAADPSRPWSPQELLAAAWASAEPTERGVATTYDDTNFLLLQLVIEKVTGEPFRHAINRLVTRPAQLTDTEYPAGTALPSPHGQGYMLADGQLRDVTAADPSFMGAGGGMVSTLRDLQRWAEVLTDGTLLTPELQTERLDWEPLQGGDLRYGLGLAETNGWIGQDGRTLGFQTACWRNPEKRATIVVSFNSYPTVPFGQQDGLPESLMRELVEIVFPGSMQADDEPDSSDHEPDSSDDEPDSSDDPESSGDSNGSGGGSRRRDDSGSTSTDEGGSDSSENSGR